MKELNKNNFESNTLKSNKPVVVKWWSEFCLQCEALTSTMKKLEEKYKNIKFYSANVSELNDIAAIWGIMSLPTVIIFKEGNSIHQFYGNLPQDVFEKELDKL